MGKFVDEEALKTKRKILWKVNNTAKKVFSLDAANG